MPENGDVDEPGARGVVAFRFKLGSRAEGRRLGSYGLFPTKKPQLKLRLSLFADPWGSHSRRFLHPNKQHSDTLLPTSSFVTRPLVYKDPRRNTPGILVTIEINYVGKY